MFVLLISPCWGSEYIIDATLNLNDVGPIKVRTIDDVSGGCWTNIKEVKNYAEDKLEMAGADLSYTIDRMAIAGARNRFDIYVSGNRLNSGLCVGDVEVSLNRFAKSQIGDHIGVLFFSRMSVAFTNPRNFNNQVLDAVKGAIGEWEGRN